ncbi:MAG: hypothetical protein COB46_02175 [Rhodospirillaceae bacterium]|nr:MAG: hypothetical protein COB46_02175 [Rhodospirillaceae bacterium]
MAVIEHLDTLGTRDLKQAWLDEFGRTSPPRASSPYMRSVLAYRIQERTGPKLSASLKRKLEQVAGGKTKALSTAIPRMKSGMKLLREWNGVTHEVLVLDKGFEYLSTSYKSLSAIARSITGTRWSGPAFFGLKGKRNGK